MSRLGIAAVVALAFSLSAAQAGSLEPHTIVVSGYAEILVKPDHATVDIGVVTSDKVTTTALEANNVLMHRVVDAIKGLGIAGSAMRTSNFTIVAQHPRAKDYGFDFTVTTGYEVSNTLTISLDDIGNVAQVIDAAVKAGANTSNSVTFDAKDRKVDEDKVLADAVRDARHNAEIMAVAEGTHVGKMISETNVSGDMNFRFPPPPPPPINALESVVIMPGQTTISANVMVIYAVE